MRAVVLGCGEIGQEVVRDLAMYAPVEEIVVGTRHPERVEELFERLPRSVPRLTAARVDVGSPEALETLMKGAEVVVNAVGPNYRYEVPVARAAIAARVNLVDVNDEYETTLEMLALDGEARRAGVTVILGLGGAPGVDAVLVKAAANQLDSVEEIHTAWLMSAAEPGGPALAAHLLRSLSDRALTVEDGRLVEVASFVDGREAIDFPAPVGRQDVWHVGHPEPLMLSRSFPGARVVTDKATFNPPEINEAIRELGAWVRAVGGPDPLAPRALEVMEVAAAELLSRCGRVTGVPREAAMRICVVGRKKGRSVRVHFSSAAPLASATGVAASIGAVMLLCGDVSARGVLPPEQCVDPTDFIYEIITRRDLAKLNGWVDD